MNICFFGRQRLIASLIFILGLNCFWVTRGDAQQVPPLFNGKDFSGWKEPKANIWWSIEDGTLVAKSDEKKKGSILWSQKTYTNFIVEMEYKNIEGSVDSGVFLRHENDQIQIGLSGSLKRDMTGSPYIASKKGYPVEAKEAVKLLKSEDWNSMTIVAKRNDYTIWLNGHHVLSYESDTAIKKGPIGLQLHSGREMSIAFRNIRLAELK